MIRFAMESDGEAVYRLLCMLEERELERTAFERIYAACLKSPDRVCLVAEQEGEVVGCLQMRLEEQLHHCAEVAEILELAVSPDCRFRGLGRALFTAAGEIAREKGCVQLQLSSGRRREEAHLFYGRLGMVQTHAGFTMEL